MKYFSLLLLSFISCFLISCSSGEKNSSEQSSDGLEIIKVDLSEAREGKLSEFFEPEIEYIWLKDDFEDAQLGGLNKVFFHNDKIFTLDIYGCKCIKIFDRAGNYFSKIRAYGEGPEKYLDFDDAIIVDEEVLLLGVFPPKLMWFDLSGNFIREKKIEKPVTGIYSENDKRYFFYSNARATDEYFVQSVDESFQDTLRFFLFKEDAYYGSYSRRKSFIKNEHKIYFGRAFNDTIMETKAGKFVPKLVFDFGEYAQSIEELKKNEENLSTMDELNFINSRAMLYFLPLDWYINDSQVYTGFKYEEEFYNVFFDRKTKKSQILDGRLDNDIDDSFDPNSYSHQFCQDKIGFYFPGKTLFIELQKKKADLGQEGFEEYVRGKGKNFAQAAFAAKDSENPVLIVYTVKK